jgi:uncharacterized membrane protein HdeD (DUF308 family)
MTSTTPSTVHRNTEEHWLRRYYFVRAGFSLAWIGAVLALAPFAAASAVLLVGYPLWDALANLADGRRNGGLRRHPGQLLNVIISLAVALGLAVALPDMHRVLAVFGAWAILSGLLQLASAVQRWRLAGAQWAMVASGAQSALAGVFFLSQARMPASPTVASLAGYAGFGALYFLLSAVLLAASARRRAKA